MQIIPLHAGSCDFVLSARHEMNLNAALSQRDMPLHPYHYRISLMGWSGLVVGY